VSTLDWLALAVALLGLLWLGAWVWPVTRPVAVVVARPVSWGLALVGTLLAFAALARRRPRRRAEPGCGTDDPGTTVDRAEHQRDVAAAETRAEHAESRATTAEAVSDPDPAAGWAALDAEERRLRDSR